MDSFLINPYTAKVNQPGVGFHSPQHSSTNSNPTPRKTRLAYGLSTVYPLRGVGATENRFEGNRFEGAVIDSSDKPCLEHSLCGDIFTNHSKRTITVGHSIRFGLCVQNAIISTKRIIFLALYTLYRPSQPGGAPRGWPVGVNFSLKSSKWGKMKSRKKRCLADDPR